MLPHIRITAAPAPDRLPHSRLAAVDFLRAAALGGMIVYHLAWDLHAFGLSPIDPGTSLPWRLFGHGVASLFLGLSGFGIALAGRGGLVLGQAARRLAAIGAAAAAVTVVTMNAAPGATVWFGILHCIFVTNLVALVLHRCPKTVLIVAGVLAAAIPIVSPPLFSGVAWAWTGLSDTQPATLDFRPALPWLGPVLFGMVAGRTRLVDGLAGFSPGAAFQRGFARCGRHTLLVYLLHQPVLIGVYGLPATGFDPAVALSEPKQAEDFLQACRQECTGHGRDVDLCVATCHCVLTATLAHPTPQRRPVIPNLDAMRPFLQACRLDP